MPYKTLIAYNVHILIQYGLNPCSLGLRDEHTPTHTSIESVGFLGIFNEQIAAANKGFVYSDVRVPHVVGGTNKHTRAPPSSYNLKQTRT